MLRAPASGRGLRRVALPPRAGARTQTRCRPQHTAPDRGARGEPATGSTLRSLQRCPALTHPFRGKSCDSTYASRTVGRAAPRTTAPRRRHGRRATVATPQPALDTAPLKRRPEPGTVHPPPSEAGTALSRVGPPGHPAAPPTDTSGPRTTPDGTVAPNSPSTRAGSHGKMRRAVTQRDDTPPRAPDRAPPDAPPCPFRARRSSPRPRSGSPSTHPHHEGPPCAPPSMTAHVRIHPADRQLPRPPQELFPTPHVRRSDTTPPETRTRPTSRADTALDHPPRSTTLGAVPHLRITHPTGPPSAPTTVTLSNKVRRKNHPAPLSALTSAPHTQVLRTLCGRTTPTAAPAPRRAAASRPTPVRCAAESPP